MDSLVRDEDLLKFKIPSGFSLDLQRFASAEAEGRTEKATEHKKKKSREEGRVALSKDMPAAVVSIVAFSTIYMLAKYIFLTIYESFRFIFENLSTIDIRQPGVFVDLLLEPTLKVFLPIAGVAFFIAGLSNYLQIGFKFTPKAIKPDFKKVNPNVIKFLGKQVFSVTGGFNLLKSIVKVVIIGSAAFITIYGKFEDILALLHSDNLFRSFTFIVGLAYTIVIRALIIMLIFSVADYFFVKWQYEESLKMKKQEIKEESKEMYGDPQVKSRLRQMYNSIMNQKKQLKEVPNSDVVITNPTHYAVALRYDTVVDEAPRVIAKGKDKFALEIRSIAKENGIFIYENPPLARSLYSDVEVNDIIPREMYGFVVNAYKLSYDQKRKRTGG